MDFWDLTKLLFRRWYIATPLLLLSVAGAAWVGSTVKPDYVATSYVQLVTPTVPQVKPGEQPRLQRNPWLNMGLSSLSGAATITVQDQTVLKQFEKQGLSQSFTLEMEGQLPIVKIEVIGKTQQQASDTARRLVSLLDSNVLALQNEYSVPAGDLITTRRLDLGDNLTENSGKVKRALVAIGGAGVLFSIAVTIGFDAWMRKRSRRRALAAEAAASGGGPEPRGGGSPASTAPQPPAQRSPASRAKVLTVGENAVSVPTVAVEEELPMTAPARPAKVGAGAAGANGAGAGGGPVAVEYRNASGGRGRRDGGRADEDAADAGPDSSLIAVIPADATVILPLSHNEDWNKHSGSGRR